MVEGNFFPKHVMLVVVSRKVAPKSVTSQRANQTIATVQDTSTFRFESYILARLLIVSRCTYIVVFIIAWY